MKVKVIKEFVDIHTGELHTIGSSFECTDARYKEIESAGKFVEEVPAAVQMSKKK